MIDLNDTFTISAHEDRQKYLLTCNFQFFQSLSCFEKRLKAYLYDQRVLSEDNAANNLVTWRDCLHFHSISRIVVPLDYSL